MNPKNNISSKSIESAAITVAKKNKGVFIK